MFKLCLEEQCNFKAKAVNVMFILVVLVILVQFGLIKESFQANNSHTGEGICPFEILKNNQTSIRSRRSEQHTVCDLMKPRRGAFPPQTTLCPWRIFIFKTVIQQQHAQPVTLGSTTGDKLFSGFLITARKLTNGELGDIIGHFEPQWDVIPHCCGSQTPNMLDGSLSARMKKANQTMLWTAPNSYIGPFVFVATVWKTVSKYWFEVKSPILNVIYRKP